VKPVKAMTLEAATIVRESLFVRNMNVASAYSLEALMSSVILIECLQRDVADFEFETGSSINTATMITL